MQCITATIDAVRGAVATTFATDKFMGVFLLLAFAIGAYAVLRFALGAACFVWRHFLRPRKNLRKYGEWAVVTGSTDGIGFAMARELARSGLNVMLMGRSADKLADSAKQICEAAPKVQVRTLCHDFAANVLDGADSKQNADIAKALKDLDIGVLVNNVGVSQDHADYFDQLEDATVETLLELNVRVTTQMTRLVLKGMVERKRGAIINVASAAGTLPTGDPLYALYSGTKAFVDFFSRSLHHEYARKGIHVQCQIPYFVVSKLSKIRHASFFTPAPKTYAKAAVSAIGHGASVVPFWTHDLQHCIIHALPVFVVKYFIMSHHLSIYKRAMDKKKAK